MSTLDDYLNKDNRHFLDCYFWERLTKYKENLSDIERETGCSLDSSKLKDACMEYRMASTSSWEDVIARRPVDEYFILDDKFQFIAWKLSQDFSIFLK